MNTKISGLSRMLLILASVCLAASIFFPLWSIDLFAPQYPEGLVLYIHADKLGGDVEIINGLNHYIGMQTLHEENFIEFSILKYILLFFAAFIMIAALIGRKKVVYAVFIVFVLFALLSMADFYRWNYNYGHNLDPNAAIKVPGMYYQPPLFGFKQLLNFGAYSMPALGGWLFIGTGVLMLFVVLMERNLLNRWLKRNSATASAVVLIATFTFVGCGTPGPRPVKINQDACAYCKMSVTEAPFAAQFTTTKGRHYIFDDIVCMAAYKKENTAVDYAHFYVADFTDPTSFVMVDQAFMIHSDSLRSPMAGNIAGFANKDSAGHYQSRFGARTISWDELMR